MVLASGLAAAFVAGCGGEEVQRIDGGDGQAQAAPEELLSRESYMGVSCPVANSFDCDRVGLAVWLREPAVRVDAAIAGADLELDDPDWSGPVADGERRMFAGFLQPAGLIDGPLKVTPEGGPGRWFGRDPVTATVELWINRDDGATDTTSVEVALSPGWG